MFTPVGNRPRTELLRVWQHRCLLPLACRPQRAAAGFTLIELLVVIAIIGILVALLLPAVQRVRETARRLQCSNNLKQIGIALHNYHDTHQTLPLSMVGPGGRSGGVDRTGFYSWLALLLPYVEQQPLADGIRFQRNMADACEGDMYIWPGAMISSTHPNAAAAATAVATYLCPSDRYDLNDLLGTARPRPGSYCGNAGWPSNTTGIDGSRQAFQHNGCIPLVNPLAPKSWHVSRVTFGDIQDGTAHTIAVTERVITRVSDWPDVPQARPFELSYCGGGSSARVTMQDYNNSCRLNLHSDLTYTTPLGRAWISGWTLIGNTYTHCRPPNTRNCHLYGGEDDGTNLISPSSWHAGGVNVMMADGSVHFMTETINLLPWWQLGSRNGGEVVGDGAF